ncbi:hypothetical protein [Polynucleobacter sp. HIN5]|uniref:hypothetical protein n=1 Tax=Polynucleobacter sp. HIN5 TaxID=3047864 RepID=UPI0025725AD9|nr:hypothetical protein [Polynucleobacter sp. HIN5]BEI33822.1 hypothetical protein PHIN5_11900 [Polynucleobacter sp. HIN5]
MKTVAVIINITFDDEPNKPNSLAGNPTTYSPKSGFNFLSSTTTKPWPDFTDKKIAADRKTSASTNVIAFPSCELLRRHHVRTGK